MSPEQLARRQARRAQRHLFARPRRVQHAHGQAALPERLGAGVDDHAAHGQAEDAGRDGAGGAVAGGRAGGDGQGAREPCGGSLPAREPVRTRARHRSGDDARIRIHEHGHGGTRIPWPRPPEPRCARLAAAQRGGGIGRTRIFQSRRWKRRSPAVPSRRSSPCWCFSIIAGSSGWWYWSTPPGCANGGGDDVARRCGARSAAPVASAVDSTKKDSAITPATTPAAAHDSTAVAAVTPVADTSAAKPVATGAGQDRDCTRPARRHARTDSRGSERRQAAHEQWEYNGAVVRFGSAQDKIVPLARKYANVPQIRSLKREISEAMSAEPRGLQSGARSGARTRERIASGLPLTVDVRCRPNFAPLSRSEPPTSLRDSESRTLAAFVVKVAIRGLRPFGGQ